MVTSLLLKTAGDEIETKVNAEACSVLQVEIRQRLLERADCILAVSKAMLRRCEELSPKQLRAAKGDKTKKPQMVSYNIKISLYLSCSV